MPAPMEKTRHAGIYKRGSRYVVVYRVNGRQRKEATRTLEEALRLKRSRETVREGLIRHNPARDVTLPHRAKIEEDDAHDVRALSREQLATVLAVAHPEHRAFLELLAATGLRWSEAIALRPRDLTLDGSTPCV